MGTRADYAVTREGQRFIVVEPRTQRDGGVLTLFVNWMSGLKPQR